MCDRDDGRRLLHRWLYSLSGQNGFPPSIPILTLFSLFLFICFPFLSLRFPFLSLRARLRCLVCSRPYLLVSRLGSAAWWQEESLPHLAALPSQQAQLPCSWDLLNHSDFLSGPAVGDDSVQAHGHGADVRVTWRFWQVPPNDFTRRDTEHLHCG